MNIYDKNKIYDLLIHNEAFFIYDLKGKKFLEIIYKNEIIIKNKSIEDIFNSDDRFIFENEDYENIAKYFDDLKYCVSKKRLCFKMQFLNSDFEWHVIESFDRFNNEDIVCGTIKDFSEVLADYDKLVLLSEQDSMTGLLNKVNIEKYITNMIEEDPKSNAIISVIDIDYFKSINDTYGHMFGDKVIKQIANRLKRYIGDSGAVGRAGGDEFIIVRKYDHPVQREEVREYARDIRACFEELKFAENEDFYCTATNGVVVYPRDGSDYITLFGKADKALYRGKKKGRDCYIIFDEALHGNINTAHEETEVQTEKEISQISGSDFIAMILDELLYSKNLGNTIKKVISEIATFFNLERVLLVENNNSNFQVKYQWSKLREFHMNEFYEINDIARYNHIFANDSIAIINNVSMPRANEMELSSFIRTKMKYGSVVQVASVDEEIDMLMSYEICSNRRLWQRQEINNFKVISKIIFSFILKNRNEKEKDA